jgi:hypothetical protein
MKLFTTGAAGEPYIALLEQFRDVIGELGGRVG